MSKYDYYDPYETFVVEPLVIPIKPLYKRVRTPRNNCEGCVAIDTRPICLALPSCRIKGVSYIFLDLNYENKTNK